LFVGTILVSGFLGAAVAHLYSEPMNSFLRGKLGRTSKKPIQIAYEPDALESGTVATS